MMARYAALAVAYLAVGALAGPTRYQSENKCATSCGNSKTFSYEEGQTYVYDYSADVETTVAGATDEASRLHMTAAVEVTANSPCDFTMKLSSVTLKDSEPSDATIRQPVDNMATFKQELERVPVSFSFDEGQVKSVCSSEADPAWVMNIKRGVLSVFNSVATLETHDKFWRTESDVAGTCLASYSVEETGSDLMVTKAKDLVGCSDRGHLSSVLQSTPYSTSSSVQSLPLLKSDQRCEQKITSGRIRTVKCEESHLFRPFSQGENGAVTRSTVSMVETSVRPARPDYYAQDEPTVRSSLLFDYSEVHAQQHVTRDVTNQAVNVLQEITAGTADDVRPQVPRLFSRLVHLLRHLSERDLMALNNQITSEVTRRYFIDALPLAGSAPAMTLMRQLIQNGDVTEQVSDKWMTSLAFVHEPTLAMVAAVGPLISAPGARRQTLLGVSSMVHNYCEKNPGCSSDDAVRMVVSSLERLLVAGCMTRSEEEEMNMLAALKALGNAGQLVGDGRALRSCFQNANTMEVRLAAVRAYRRMPCNVISESGLIKTFENRQEDTEVRIAAYLAIMQCPTTVVVDKVVEILSQEEVSQVSSFVWSHLSSMKTTSDPNKQYMKSLLYNIDLARKYNSDARKFSRYFERTFFFEDVNAGATIDADVIFSPESYIPRSGKLNFTVDLFGQAVNLLEVGGRVEGLEDFSESLFGEKGLYPVEAISTMMKAYSSSDRIPSPKASTYTRIFGNELKFNKYDSLKELMNSMNCNGPLDFLQKLAKDMDWTENYQFLDSSYTLPTMTGFTFTLKAEGTAALSIKTGGKFDVQSWKAMNIEGHIKPSAAISIRSEMKVDAFVAHAGLKMDTNLHTSTVFEGHAVVDSGKLISVRINMPRDKVEVLDVTTRFHSVHRNKIRDLDMNNGGERYELQACADRYISTILLGVNFCTDLMYTRPTTDMPRWILAGPITARFIIEKTDADLKAFELQYRHSDKSGIRKSSLLFDTTGSANDRRISFDYMINFISKAFRVGIHTPWKSADLTGSLNLDGATKQAGASLRVDDAEVFGFDSQLAIYHNPVSVRYAPELTVRGPYGDIVTVEGGFIANNNKHKYHVHMTVSKYFATPVVFKGDVNEDEGTYSMTSSFESAILDTNTQGTFRFADDNLLVQTTTDYSFMDGERQTLYLSGKLSGEEREDEDFYRMFVDTKFSALPILDTQLTLEFLDSEDSWDGQLLLKRGERSYLLTSLVTSQEDKLTGSLGFVAPHWDVDFKVAGAVDFSQDYNLMADLEVQLRKDMFAKTKFAVVYKNDDYNFQYGFLTSLTVPSSTYTLEAGIRREETAGHLKMVFSRETPEERKEFALVSLLELEDSQTSLDLTLSVPFLPRMQASATLVPGTGGVYMTKALAQYGTTKYMVGGELKMPERKLELLLEMPRRKYSAMGSVTKTAGSWRLETDIRFGRRIVANAWTNTDLDFRNANFEIFWNKDLDDSEKATLEVVRRTNVLAAVLVYPGNEVKLDATLLRWGFTADLQYLPEKVIHARGGYELLETEDGTRAYINVRTPIEKFNTLSLEVIGKGEGHPAPLKFEVIGAIEDQRMALKADVTARLYYRNHDLLVDLDLTTPFAGWERNKFKFDYKYGGDAFSTYLTATKNDDVFSVGGAFEMSQLPELFKISTSVDLVLPFVSMQKGKIGFDFKMGEGHLAMDVLTLWKRYSRDNKLGLTLDSKYALSPFNLDSTLTVVTPFPDFEKFRMNLLSLLNEQSWPVNTQFSVAMNDQEQLHTALTSESWMHSTLVFNCYACLPFDIAYTITPPSYDNLVYGLNTIAHVGDKEYEFTYRQETRHTDAVSTNMVATLRIPENLYRLTQRQTVDMEAKGGSQYIEWAWNDKKIVVDMDLKFKNENYPTGQPKSVSVTSYGKLQTPFQGWRSAHISRTQEVSFTEGSGFPVEMTSTTQISKESQVNMEIVDTFNMADSLNWDFREEITGTTEWVKNAVTTMKLSASPEGSAKFDIESTWDGKTAQLTYSHVLPTASAGKNLDITTTAKWYSGTAKSAHLHVGFTDENIEPTLTLTDVALDQPIKIHGNISLRADGRSQLFVSGLFREQVTLTATYKMMGPEFQAMLEYEHFDSNRYSVDLKVRPDFTEHALFKLDMKSPTDCMGTALLRMEYMTGRTFFVRGALARNSWKVATDGEFGPLNGSVELATPYEGYRTMSLTYTFGESTGELRLNKESSQIRIVLEDKAPLTGTDQMILRINTPYHRFETINIVFTNDHEEDKILIDYTRGRYASASFVAQYEISGPKSFLSIKAESSVPGYSTAELVLNYDLIAQNATAKFVKEGRVIETNLDADLSLLNSRVNVEYRNTLLPSFEQLTISGEFDFRDAKKTIDAELSIDNTKLFEFETKAKTTLDESFLKVEVDSTSFPKFEMKTGYELVSPKQLDAKFELSKGDFGIRAFLQHLQIVDGLTTTLTVSTVGLNPYQQYRRLKLSSEVSRESVPAVAKLAMEIDSHKYEIVVRGEIGGETSYITATTPFRGLERLGAELQLNRVGHKEISILILTCNDHKIEAELERKLSLSNPLLALKIVTPFREVSRLVFFVQYDLTSEQKTFNAVLARNDKQVKLNIASTFSSGKATTLFELETPIVGWENVKATAAYDLNGSEKIMEISYERNGVKKVLASRGSFDSEQAYIDLITPIEGYERMGISGKYVSRRGKREAGYEAHVNDHRHRVYVLYERKGLDSAKLRIESPISNMNLIEADVRTQQFEDGVGYYITTNRDGKRSSAEIRTVSDGNRVGVDISIRSYIEGLENLQLSGNIVYRGKKRSFSFSSARGGNQQASVSGQIVMKKRGGNGSLKAALPMLSALEDVNLTFNYKLGATKSFSLTSTRNGVTRKFSGDLRYSGTSFEVNLNTPYEGFTTLHADASRTTAGDGRVSAIINLQREQRKIEIAYDYLFEKSSGSGKINIETLYEGFRSMMTSLEYTTGGSSRSFNFKASRGSRYWSIETTRNWSNGVDTANLDVATPIEELRTLKISRTFNIADLSNMEYDASYERNGKKFALGGTGSIVEDGKKVDFDVTLTTPLRIKKLTATVRYDFRSLPGSIYAKFAAGRRYAQLNANVGATTGSATLETTNKHLPSVEGSYNVVISPVERDININMKLADGRQLTITYVADFSKPNQANGELNVVSTTYGARKLTWAYSTPNDDVTASLVYNSPNGGFNGDFSVTGTAYQRRKITLTTSINIPDVYVSSQTTKINYNMRNGAMVRVKIDYNGKKYDGYFKAVKTADGKRKVEITYDGQLLKNIKIDGTWTIPQTVEGRKEFDITYKRGNKKGTVNGFVDLSPSGKSGSFEISVASTLEELKKLDVSGNWDVVLPNRVFSVNYNRNGRRFNLNFSGQRFERNGDYVFTVSFPRWEVVPGKFISEYASSVSYDLRDRVFVKVAQTKPVEEKLEFDVRIGLHQRNVRVLYHFVNTNDLVSYMPERLHVEFSSDRKEREQGAKVDLKLKTGFPGFALVTATIDVNAAGPAKTITIDYKRGLRTGQLVGTIEETAKGKVINFILKTPLEGYEEVTATASYELDHGKSYKLNIDYARGQKFVRLTSSLGLGPSSPTSGSIDVDIKLDSYITMPVDLLVTLDGSVIGTDRKQSKGELKVVFNGDTYLITQTGSRRLDRREMSSKIVIQTPHKYPYKKIIYTSSYSLLTNKASWAVDYGRKKISLGVSWFAGEAKQYGAELRLQTPFRPVRTLELDVKGTVRQESEYESSLDVMVHYLRNEVMVHVTGNVRPYAADLDVNTPWGSANVKAGVKTTESHSTQVLALVDIQEYGSVGAVVTLKLGNPQDMQAGIDIHTPLRNWRRFNIELAYTNIEESNVVRVVFDSPVTKRVELSFELTNMTDSNKTDFRAGVTTNYLGKAFTFRTNILRDSYGMKYELEVESPFHILPSFKLTGRR